MLINKTLRYPVILISSYLNMSDVASAFLLVACTEKSVDIVKTIIKSGADVYAVDNNNESCFHYASRNTENVDILIYLMKNVGNSNEMLNATSNDGYTPLDLVMKHSDASYLYKIISAHIEILENFDSPSIITIVRNDERDFCPICKKEFEVEDKAFLLGCYHPFHQDCFFEYSKKDLTCPCCKTFAFKLKEKPEEIRSIEMKDVDLKKGEVPLSNSENSCCCIC